MVVFNVAVVTSATLFYGVLQHVALLTPSGWHNIVLTPSGWYNIVLTSLAWLQLLFL
jgi:hypothetical protein